MNRAQRVVLAAYCLLIFYCSVWVPWCVSGKRSYESYHERVGYGWLWAGPHRDATIAFPSKTDPDTTYEEVDARTRGDEDTAMPDLPLVGLRFLAVTALAVAAFLIVGVVRPTRT